MNESSEFIPKSILVVEDDDTINSFITDALLAKNIDTKGFTDGNQAWENARQHHYDFIILDWKVPTVSGFILFNRFRQDESYRYTPILVISGFLKSKDFSLLEEYPFSAKLEKPFNLDALLTKVKQLSEEARWFQEKEAAFRRLFQSPGQDHGERYLKSILEMEEKSPNPFKVALVSGMALRSLGFFAEAEILLKRALRHKPHSLLVMNELGKLYLQSNRNPEAKHILKAAMEQSPDNIERICQLGTLSLQDCEPNHAKTYFDRALALDPQNNVATSGMKLAQSIENWLAINPSPLDSYAGLLNAIGVSMVRGRKFEEGIDHYQSALQHIFDNKTKARLSFNVGLGYKKWRRISDAVTWFKESLVLDPTFTGASEQIDKLQQTVDAPTGPAPLPDLKPEDVVLGNPTAILESDLNSKDDSLFDDIFNSEGPDEDVGVSAPAPNKENSQLLKWFIQDGSGDNKADDPTSEDKDEEHHSQAS